MKKKGVSETVSLSLIILIALIAVSILAILIYSIIQGGNLGNVETLSYSSKINVVAGSMEIIQEGMTLKVKRNNIAANIVGFAVIIEDVDGRRFIHEVNEPIVALETKEVSLSYSADELGAIKKVFIVPKFSVGEEIITGTIEATYVVKTSDFLCGDGTVDDGEDCDTTEDTATCDYDLGDGPQACTLAICSDGYLNTAAGETCDDGNVVAGDGCDATCQLECTSDADCTNNLFCDGVETCDASSTCQAGIPVNPDDGVSCTNDSCNEATDSIDNTPDDTVCDDGLFCTVGDICDATLDCQTGTPVNPDDGVLCTDDSCDEANDVLVNFANM